MLALAVAMPLFLRGCFFCCVGRVVLVIGGCFDCVDRWGCGLWLMLSRGCAWDGRGVAVKERRMSRCWWGRCLGAAVLACLAVVVDGLFVVLAVVVDCASSSSVVSDVLFLWWFSK